MLDSASIFTVQATLSNIDICCNYADYQILCLSGSSCMCLQTEAMVNFQLLFHHLPFFLCTFIIHSVICRRGLMLQLCMWTWNIAVFPLSLIITWNFWTCSRCVKIYHLMISLPFCLQSQTILLGKNSNRAIIVVRSTSSDSFSLQTSLMQTLDCQQCCSEEIGSRMCVSYAEAS